MICEKTASALPQVPPFQPETDCPLDRAKMIMEFCSKNSCGHCVLCREGTLQIFSILQDDVTGFGREDDKELLLELCKMISDVAGCEMAQEAANACAELITAHADQFEQHILRKRCQNLVCKHYYTLHISPSDCTGCGECLAVCPKNAIKGGKDLIHVIDNDVCDRCLECVAVCKSSTNAIQKAGAVKPKYPEEPVAVGSFEDGGGKRRRRG